MFIMGKLWGVCIGTYLDGVVQRWVLLRFCFWEQGSLFSSYQKFPKLRILTVNDCQIRCAKFLKLVLALGIESWACFHFGTPESLSGGISSFPATSMDWKVLFPHLLSWLFRYFISHKPNKTWQQVFWFAISIAINNAYILYKMSEAYHVTRYSRAQFGERLVKELLGLEDISPSHWCIVLGGIGRG